MRKRFDYRFAISRVAVTIAIVGVTLTAVREGRSAELLDITQLEGGNVRLSWPADISGAVLERNSELDQPQAWRIGPQAPVLSGGQYTLELPIDSPNQFFRLNTSPIIFVDFSASPGGNGSFLNPLKTIATGLTEAMTRFAQSGTGQTLYVFFNNYPEMISVNGAPIPGLDITVLSSRLPLTVNGQTVGGDPRAVLTAPSGQIAVDVRNCERFSLFGFDVAGSNAEGMKVDNVPWLSVQDTTLTSSGGRNGLRLLNIEHGDVTFSAITVGNTLQSGIDIDSFGGSCLLSDLDDNKFEDVLSINGTGAGFPGIDIAGSSDAEFTFHSIDISNTGAEGVRLADAGTVRLSAKGRENYEFIGMSDINSTNGDGIRSTNTDIVIHFASIGVFGAIHGDGVEIINNDGRTHSADIVNSNIFGLGAPDPTGRGIFLNAQSGTLIAGLHSNLYVTDQSTIASQDGGAARSLIIDMTGNSTLTTNLAHPTMALAGNGLHSTIVRAWDYPNQVIGGFSTSSSGILFDRVTFDADGNPSNGIQQVAFDGGKLDIGQVPPFSIQRVKGNGLTFLRASGDLRIGVLNIANQNGTGLFVDSTGTSFNLDIGSSTINTLNGSQRNF